MVDLAIDRGETMKTEVKHSDSKSAWNIVSVESGGKYKIARVPYFIFDNDKALTEKNINEAFEHALFISKCFNELK